MAESSLHYVQISTDMARHPKTLKLARIRKWDQPRTFVFLVHLLMQVARYAPHGAFNAKRAEELAESAANEAGVPSLELDGLVGALTATGWLDEVVGGDYQVHGWGEIYWAAMARREAGRAANAARQRLWRAAHKNNATVTGRNALRESYGHYSNGPIEEKSRVEERNEEKDKPPQSPPHGGASGEDADFFDLSPDRQAAAPAAAQTAEAAPAAEPDRFEEIWALVPPEHRVGKAEARTNYRRCCTVGPEIHDRIAMATKNYYAWCAACARKPKDLCRFIGAPTSRAKAPYVEFITPPPLPARTATTAGRRTTFRSEDYEL